MEEASGRHEEPTEVNQRKCIQDLSNRVYELGLKIEQLSNSSADTAMLPRIEFPRFSGEDFSGWIYKCDQFFQVYKNTPDELKVRLASIHMEGDALRWHKKYMKTQNPAPVWDEYVRNANNVRDPGLIEEEAKSCYADDGQLGYPADHDIFSKRSNHPRFREKVIKAGKWKQPSELFRRALYELLLLPELEAQKSRPLRAAKGLWGMVFASTIQWLWLQQQQPTDLLHGLQLLILGPEQKKKKKSMRTWKLNMRQPILRVPLTRQHHLLPPI
ncbi:UNVERIFIED_CONTAM: hypothetical protein Scaly_2574900 [Sesamum calycinum]|uniref:Retrotransposon gag domain-containing protein n=1 Tax=Sesamum calycinum TaxID=2727403 RepID=A0AAW2JIL7_9LAMI